MEVTKEMEDKIRQNATVWADSFAGKHSPIRLEWFIKQLVNFAIDILDEMIED